MVRDSPEKQVGGIMMSEPTLVLSESSNCSYPLGYHLFSLNSWSWLQMCPLLLYIFYWRATSQYCHSCKWKLNVCCDPSWFSLFPWKAYDLEDLLSFSALRLSLITAWEKLADPVIWSAMHFRVCLFGGFKIMLYNFDILKT